jgi:hypothetical protein
MKVLCTGISGVGKRKYLDSVKSWVEENSAGPVGKRHEVRIFDSGEYIRKAGKDLRIEVTDKKVLDLSNLDELRAIAFERICCELEKEEWGPSRHALISTHACFRWNKYMRTGFDAHYLKRLGIDMYVNIYEEASSVLRSHQESEQWKGRLELPEIIAWRDEELFLTEVFSDFDEKPFYLVAKAEPPLTLGRLVANPDCKKIYLSYPISAIQKSQPERLDEVAKYADRLREKYVVFNPLSIKDLVLLLEAPCPDPEKQHLRAQTVWRDFKLIRQSDMVAVYYPVQENSPGVNQEIVFGYTHNKDVVLYYPREYSLSPFWDKNTAVSKICGTVEEWLEFLGISS